MHAYSFISISFESLLQLQKQLCSKLYVAKYYNNTKHLTQIFTGSKLPFDWKQICNYGDS